MKRSIFIAVVVLIFFRQAGAGELTPTTSGLFDVGGFKLYLACYQNGKPQLIIESGFGLHGSDGVWQSNIEKLSTEFSVCVYDRMGLGKSEKGPVPFDVNNMAVWLHTLLNKANIKGPYYFAGGSYASYIIRVFNNLYPSEFVGAVLIDPPPYGYFHTMATRWPNGFTTDNEDLKRYMAFEQSVKDPMFAKVPENVDHMKSYQHIKAARDFGDKPLIVLISSPKRERYDPDFVPEKIAMVMDSLMANKAKQFATLSSKAEIVYSQSTKHHLHIADPDLVVNSIRALLQKSEEKP